MSELYSFEGVYFGHYIVDGECVACGHKVGDLERFTFVTPPPEIFWDDEMISRVPKVIRNMIKRMDR